MRRFLMYVDFLFLFFHVADNSMTWSYGWKPKLDKSRKGENKRF